MIRLFLNAKHWQLFIVLFAIPVILNIFLMINFFQEMTNHDRPDPAAMLGYFRYFPVLMLVVGGTLFGWLWSIGVGLQEKIPANVHMNITRFKIFLLIPVVYIAIISLVVGQIFSSILTISQDNPPDFSLIAGSMVLIIPLHLFSMFCIFYCLYFVSKTIKTVELQRETSFSDFAGEFVLMWFNVIGVWILQPRINKMVQPDSAESL